MNTRFRQAKTRFSRSRWAVFLAAFWGLLGFAALMYLALTAQRGLPARSYYEVTTEFRNAGNMSRFSEVRIGGRRVGQVVALHSSQGIARLRLQLAPGTQPLPVDSSARIRLKGLLGGKFVELTRGHASRLLPNGATLPLGQTSTTTDLIDTLQTLDRRRRSDLRATVRALGAGLAANGQPLNAALHTGPALMRDASAVAQAILSRHGAAARLAPSVDELARALDPVREEFARGFDPGARALQPFTDARQDLHVALDIGGAALDTVRTGLAQTDALLVQTAGFARAAARLTRPAPAAFRATTALLRESRRPLRMTRVLLRRLQSAIPPTLELTRSVDPLIAPLIRAARNAAPMLRTVGDYGCDYLGFVRNWRSSLAFGPKLAGPLGPATMLRAQLTPTGDLRGDTSGPRAGVGRDPYAAPCTATSEALR
jgi:virulence factor Mce-like protein